MQSAHSHPKQNAVYCPVNEFLDGGYDRELKNPPVLSLNLQLPGIYIHDVIAFELFGFTALFTETIGEFCLKLNGVRFNKLSRTGLRITLLKR